MRVQLNKKELDLLRAEKCIPMRELAKQAHVSYSSLTGKKTISVMTLGKIAKALNADPRSLVLDEN